MMRRTLLFGICLLLFVPAALAQDVPDEIDDFDDDFEEVIEQLADDGYIDEDEGELIFEDSRVNYDDEDDDFRFFRFNDEGDVQDIVIAATLEIDADRDAEESELCIMTLRDDQDGFIGVGLNSLGFYLIIDQVYEEDDSFFTVDEYDDNDDNEAHIIVVLLEDEITVYIDGELIYADDDFSEREGTFGLLRTEGTDCQAEDLWVWEIEGASSSDDDRDDEDDEGSSLGGLNGALDDRDEDAEDDNGRDEDADDEDVEMVEFTAPLFTFEYPASLELEPLELSDRITLGTMPIGWLFPGLGRGPVDAVDDNLDQWGLSLAVIDLESTPPEPDMLLAALLGNLEENNPDTEFGSIITDDIGSMDGAYIDFLDEGRRWIVFSPGDTYVTVAILYAHPDEIDDQYETVRPILESVDLR